MCTLWFGYVYIVIRLCVQYVHIVIRLCVHYELPIMAPCAAAGGRRPFVVKGNKWRDWRKHECLSYITMTSLLRKLLNMWHPKYENRKWNVQTWRQSNSSTFEYLYKIKCHIYKLIRLWIIDSNLLLREESGGEEIFCFPNLLSQSSVSSAFRHFATVPP